MFILSVSSELLFQLYNYLLIWIPQPTILITYFAFVWGWFTKESVTHICAQFSLVCLLCVSDDKCRLTHYFMWYTDWLKKTDLAFYLINIFFLISRQFWLTFEVYSVKSLWERNFFVSRVQFTWLTWFLLIDNCV